MFKKLIALMMVVSIFTVSAHASTQTGLKAAFDELNFALTVEWDQKDKAFHTEQMKIFTTKIRELQAKGLTKEQLVEFVQGQVKDEKIARDLETVFNMISINKMSSEEASKYMVDTMKNSYSAGASYLGEVVLYTALTVLLVAAAVSVAAGGGSYGGVYVGYCTDYYVCDTSRYYDWEWGYVCYDDCYWSCY